MPILLLILSLIGVLDAAYLSYNHLFDTESCGAGSSCGEVLGSAYGVLFGLPLSVYGLGLYLSMLHLSWRALDDSCREEAIRGLSILSAFGVAASLLLVYLQASVIRSWCPFCLFSAAVQLGILCAALLYRRRNLTLLPFVGSFTSHSFVPATLALIVVPLCHHFLASGVQDLTQTRNHPEAVAAIGDRKITIDAIDKAIQLKLYSARNELRQEWLDRQVLDTAAGEAGLSVRKFVQQEVYANIEITAEEIDRRYQEVRHRLPPNTPKASIERNIRNEIGTRKSKAALDRFVVELKGRYGTSYRIPVAERFAFDPNPRGGPEIGPLGAPVTIVEFSDLECGYCARAHEYLKELIKRRDDDVRLVFKHLPLGMHEHARYAAEVAACGHEQGKFWSVVDLLYSEQDELTRERIDKFAETAGLDAVALARCLEDSIGHRIVRADIAEADALGLSSTPSFFINGHYIGSLPKEGLDTLIENELAASGR